MGIEDNSLIILESDIVFLCVQRRIIYAVGSIYFLIGLLKDVFKLI